MGGKFFTFIKPYLNYIDAGKLYKQPFKILYLIIAVLMLLFPLYALYELFSSMRGASAGLVMIGIVAWLIIAGAGWFSFQFWWNRAGQISDTSKEGDEFVATPVISTLIQNTGEWFGSYLAVVGFLFCLLSVFIGGANAGFLYRLTGMHTDVWGLISMPIAGFLIIVGSRWIAEMYRALVSIANNTKKRKELPPSQS